MNQVWVVIEIGRDHIAPLAGYFNEPDADAHADEANCSFRNASDVRCEVYPLPLIEGGDND